MGSSAATWVFVCQLGVLGYLLRTWWLALQCVRALKKQALEGKHSEDLREFRYRVAQLCYRLRLLTSIALSLAFLAAVLGVVHGLNPAQGGLLRLQAGLYQQKIMVMVAWHLGLGLMTVLLAFGMRHRLGRNARCAETHIQRQIEEELAEPGPPVIGLEPKSGDEVSV